MDPRHNPYAVLGKKSAAEKKAEEQAKAKEKAEAAAKLLVKQQLAQQLATHRNNLRIGAVQRLTQAGFVNSQNTYVKTLAATATTIDHQIMKAHLTITKTDLTA